MKFHRFAAPGAVDLEVISPDHPEGLDKQDAKERFEKLNGELFELQDLLWGAKTHSVLVVLQGRDAAGKDGAIKHVVGALNPRGVQVTSFGVPTTEERQHDFLWRVHKHAPRAGEFSILNRSHYEDVLVARVKKLVAKPVWTERYQLINGFEQTLAHGRCIVLKYFLHISMDEQEERLLEREKNPKTAWKLNLNDWQERAYWDDFTEAYEDAIGKCAAKHAPWVVVPANSKWYRNLVVAESIAEALRPYRKGWQKKLDEDGKAGRRALKEWRAEQKAAEKGGEEG